ncbi:hypothetical protein PR202_ga27213 [Eleusine coracana subsp. coracana]|uniref:FAS1 domain-containing protein n=1 Tax=Eleusine coracana subsp. coracana TaxID=191504 RepID=A0AAV5DFF4_ELECO|nr:hypothetical protein PR202_ga27213 [Eleusine coracana subsp. coracana]
MGRVVAAALLACILLPVACVRGRNITTILSGYKEYKLYNKYLSETKVCDEINDRQSTSMTILVLRDAAMSTLVSDAGDSLPAIKNALRLLAVLDYYDRKKVKKYGGERADTLFQATGDAVSATGNVRVTDVEDGAYGFASATAGADVSSVTKEVKTQPFRFAILELDAPIEFDGLFDTPSTANLTRLLERAGCKTFATLVAGNPGVLKDYEAAMETGLTLFAPNDAAFMAKGGVPDVTKMSSANVSALLRYHALPAYYPKPSLKAVKKDAALLTLAAKKTISVKANGDDVGLEAGGSKSRVADTVVDKAPFCLMTVDKLLVPAELAVAQAPSPAPAPAPSTSERRPADAPSDEAADHAADHHKAKKSTSSDSASSRPVGAAFAAAVGSVVLAAAVL